MAIAIYLQKDFFVGKPIDNYILLEKDRNGFFYKGFPILALLIPMQLLFIAGLMNWKKIKQRIHFDIALISSGFFLSLLFYVNNNMAFSTFMFVAVAIYTIFVLSKRAFSPSPETLSPSLPRGFFIVCILALIPIYIFFSLASKSSDMGYSGAIGADLVMRGENIYNNFPEGIKKGDTYGPLNYLSYIPFELAFPWSGSWDYWDYWPSARAANIFFFFGAVVALFFIGRRFYDTKKGLVMAFALLSFPISLVPLYAVTNDSLVVFCMLLTFLFATTPSLKGVFAGASAMTKWFPLLLAPLFSKLDKGGIDNLRSATRVQLSELFGRKTIIYWLFFFMTVLLLMIDHLFSPGIRVIYENSLNLQFTRKSPFSIWWYIPEISFIVKPLFTSLIVILGISFIFIKQNFSFALTACLAAILLLLLQLALNNWYFTYFIWVLPFILLSFFSVKK